MNRPVKKMRVDHSTPAMASSTSWRPMRSMIPAAVRATVEDSRCSWEWKMKAKTTMTIITTLLMSRGRSLMALLSSS